MISVILWPGSKPAKVLLFAANFNKLYLSDINIFELHDVIKRKTPQALASIEIFLTELTYELVIAPAHSLKLIPDPKDQPILNAAILVDVDYIITGDKHFLNLGLDHPKSITAAEFLELIVKND